MDDNVTIEQIEAMLRIAGIRSEHSVQAILEMIKELLEKNARNVGNIRGDGVECYCAELTESARSRLSALYFARMHPDEARKVCSKCGHSLPLMSFHKDSRKGDGRQGMCKECKRRNGIDSRNAQRLAFEAEWFE